MNRSSVDQALHLGADRFHSPAHRDDDEERLNPALAILDAAKTRRANKTAGSPTRVVSPWKSSTVGTQRVVEWLRWGTCVTGEFRTRTVIKLAPTRLPWAHHQEAVAPRQRYAWEVSLVLLPLLLPSHCRPIACLCLMPTLSASNY
jgi:hypothetical protein